MTIEQILANADNLGTMALVLLIAYAGYKQGWVFGWYHRQLVKYYEDRLAEVTHERDRLLDMLLATLQTAEKTSNVASGALSLARKRGDNETQN